MSLGSRRGRERGALSANAWPVHADPLDIKPVTHPTVEQVSACELKTRLLIICCKRASSLHRLQEVGANIPSARISETFQRHYA